MKFTRIIHALYCETWLITPQMHSALCDILHQHVTGAAHEAGGIAGLFEEQDEPQLDVTGDGIAVIPIHGVIGKRVGMLAKSSGVLDIDQVRQMLDEAETRRDVRGMLLDIDSPGGTVTGVPEVAARIAALTKPTAAYTETQMASAAYWLGSQADLVLASPSASVGSIGVYVAWLDESRAQEMAGYKTELIKAGKFKAMGIRGIPLSDEQRSLLQAQVDELHGWFSASVTETRDVDDETMQGQTFTGRQAVANGLVDTLVDGRAEAIQELSDLIDA